MPNQTVGFSHKVNHPLVIGHRGACGYLPEHTLASYRLAIEMGADFIEPDLVLTQDGCLIARHDNELSLSTDVAQHQEYADRYTTKRVDGMAVSGWFSEDFKLEEIKCLCAKGAMSKVHSGLAIQSELFEVPTLEEVITLISREEVKTGRRVGLYPETKFPTYFAHEGRYLDGDLINRSISQLLIEVLLREGFTESDRLFIQSFEFANLIELHDRIMPSYGLDLPLIQLFGDIDGRYLPPDDNFSIPYDMLFHVKRGSDLNALYGDLTPVVRRVAEKGYQAMVSASVIESVAAEYASGIGPWIKNLLPSSADCISPGDKSEVSMQKGLYRESAPHPLVEDAIKAGLSVHAYPLCEILSPQLSKDPGWRDSMRDQLQLLFGWGVDGIFCNHPDIGIEAKRLFLERCASNN